MKLRAFFFEEINKTDKFLDRLTKKQKEKTPINKVKNKRGDITTDIK